MFPKCFPTFSQKFFLFFPYGFFLGVFFLQHPHLVGAAYGQRMELSHLLLGQKLAMELAQKEELIQAAGGKLGGPKMGLLSKIKNTRKHYHPAVSLAKKNQKHNTCSGKSTNTHKQTTFSGVFVFLTQPLMFCQHLRPPFVIGLLARSS